MENLSERKETGRAEKRYKRSGSEVVEVFGAPNPYRLEGLEDELEDIEYRTSGGRVFSFKSILPADWKLIRSSLLEPDRPMLSAHKEKVVAYSDTCWIPRAYRVPADQELPQETRNEEFIRLVNTRARGVLELKSFSQVERAGFFLGLLHEIGHAVVFENMTPEEKKVFKEGQARLDTQKKDERSTKDKEALLKDERAAWAWALHTFRRLRQSGIDLEPKLDSNEKVFKGIAAALETRKDLDTEKMVEALRAALFVEK